jgi:hypothetical protein
MSLRSRDIRYFSDHLEADIFESLYKIRAFRSGLMSNRAGTKIRKLFELFIEESSQANGDDVLLFALLHRTTDDNLTVAISFRRSGDENMPRRGEIS